MKHFIRTYTNLSFQEIESFCNSWGDIKNISHKELCEAPTTVVAIEDAVKKINLNKNPDNDVSFIKKNCFTGIFIILF